MHINWFPGHMAKAHRMIREHVALVDVVIELLDARIPASSANPVIDEVIADKPRVIALNKADLAETAETEKWAAHYRRRGFPVVLVEAVSGKGAKNLVSQVETAASLKLRAWEAKGIRPRAVRAMILGIPNVGKSSLINRLRGATAVRTADKPGVTRGKQWIKIGRNLELLDTPGVLWPKLEDQEAAFRLAVTGAIADDVFDMEDAVNRLLLLLWEGYGDRLTQRYGIPSPLPATPAELLHVIGSRRGCLLSGGRLDADKTRRLVLNEFRSGKLGAFTLDRYEVPV